MFCSVKDGISQHAKYQYVTKNGIKPLYVQAYRRTGKSYYSAKIKKRKHTAKQQKTLHYTVKQR